MIMMESYNAILRVGDVLSERCFAKIISRLEYPSLAGVVSECGIWVPLCKSVGQNEQETAEIVSTMMITEIL